MAKYEHTETITWSDDSVTMSQAMCSALLEFASTDATRTSISSVGVSDGSLAATDGHSLLRYDAPQREPVKAQALHQRSWSRDHVERAFKVAKLDKTDVVLKYDALQDSYIKFPPIAQVIPEPGFGKGKSHKQEPVAVNPEYLARMVKVCKALGAQGCLLTSMRGALDPVMYQVGGRKGCDVQATVVIMPMRY